jgi:glycerol kinase
VRACIVRAGLHRARLTILAQRRARSITGLSRGVGRAHIARALVEALAYQVRAMTDAFATNGIVLRELRADGGAAAMDLLMQLQATNSRLPVLRSSSLEATARGAATIAGLGTGIWNSLDELSTTVAMRPKNVSTR